MKVLPFRESEYEQTRRICYDRAELKPAEPEEEFSFAMKLLGGILAISVSAAIWWALIWGGLEGYKHVNSWIRVLLGALR